MIFAGKNDWINPSELDTGYCPLVRSLTPTNERLAMSKEFLLIRDNGIAYLVESDESTLSTLQTLVDGYVECVTADKRSLGFEADVWVNEEGLFRQDFSINLVASFITGRQIVGPAVLARSSKDGKTLGLTSGNINRLIEDGLMIETADEGSGNPYTLTDLVAELQKEEVDA